MNPAVTPVVELAQVNEILSGFNPSTHGHRVGDAWVFLLQESEVDSILEGELDVTVVKLQPADALAEVPFAIEAELASSTPYRTPAVLFEVPVVGVGLPRWVGRVVDGVTSSDWLAVFINHGASDR